MKFFLVLFVLIAFFSCKSRESIELRYRNYLKLYNNEIRVKISPSRFGDSAHVRVCYNEKAIKKRNKKFKMGYVKRFYKNTINIEDYRKMVMLFHAIKEEDLKYSRQGIDSLGREYFLFIGADGGKNTLLYKKGNNLKKYSVQGMSELYKNFYEATILILKSGNVNSLL